MLSACAPTSRGSGFYTGNSATTLAAIEDAARNRDDSALPALVEQLDSADAAVRFAAINTLRDLTGESFGYRYYDDAKGRALAIDRWVEYVRQRNAAHEPPSAVPMNATTGSTAYDDF